MKKWRSLVAALIVALAGAYFGSAYLAVHKLRESALAGDAATMERLVDFPSVRESIKSQLNAAIMEQMRSDPEMAANPFAGLGLMLVPALVESAVDAYVSADGLAALAQGQRPSETTDRSVEQVEGRDGGSLESGFQYTTRWVGLDDFRVSVVNTEAEGVTIQLHMARQGLFDWRLTRVELDKSMFKQMQ